MNSYGYVRVTTKNPQISDVTLSLIYSAAITAQKTANSQLALDSFGTDPCNNGAGAWVNFNP